MTSSGTLRGFCQPEFGEKPSDVEQFSCLENGLETIRKAFDLQRQRMEKEFKGRLEKFESEQKEVMNRVMEENSALMKEKTLLQGENFRLKNKIAQLEAVSSISRIDRDFLRPETDIKSDSFNDLTLKRDGRVANDTLNSDSTPSENQKLSSNPQLKDVAGIDLHSDLLAEIDRSITSAKSAQCSPQLNRISSRYTPLSSKRKNRGRFYANGNSFGNSGSVISSFSTPQYNRNSTSMRTYNYTTRTNVDKRNKCKNSPTIHDFRSENERSPSPIPIKSVPSEWNHEDTIGESRQKLEFNEEENKVSESKKGLLPEQDASQSNGREFFKLARSSLSSKQFDILLGTMRQLNRGTISRKEAIHVADQLFGKTKGDLCSSFKKLLLGELPV